MWHSAPFLDLADWQLSSPRRASRADRGAEWSAAGPPRAVAQGFRKNNVADRLQTQPAAPNDLRGPHPQDHPPSDSRHRDCSHPDEDGGGAATTRR